MYCPNCKQEYDGKFCPECGAKLIEKPTDSGVSVNLGDANAISGGLHVTDSHDVTNIDNSVHNITNTSSTVTNITHVAAQKTEMELFQERKVLYLNACRRAYEDNVLEQSEKMELDRYRIELGLDEATADNILDQVRMIVERNSQKTELTGLGRIKLKQLTEALKKNETQAIIRQIDSIEALAGKFANDELQYKYYLVLAALRHEKCIEKYETSKVDNYWKSFWTYFAYLKSGQTQKASEIMFSLSSKFPGYPEDNSALLAAAEALIKNNKKEAQEYLTAVEGNYTPALQRFAETVYLKLDSETAKDMGATEDSCAFYLVNFFKQGESSKPQQDESSMGEKQDSQRTDHVKQEDEALKGKWRMMTAEAFKMMLDMRIPDDVISVLNMVMPPAMAGIPMAIAYTAMIFNSIGKEKEAQKWADKLMDMDSRNEDVEVMIAKGRIYQEGVGCFKSNAEKSIAFYKAAGTKGSVEALCYVADIYYEGKIISQDDQMSLSWAKQAYERKNAYGEFIYGRSIFEGRGLPKDKVKARSLLYEAANKKEQSFTGAILAEKYIKEKQL